MARSCMWLVLLVALPLMACAQGFQGNDDDDDDNTPRVDAPGVVIDAPQTVDARIIDAPTSQIDAPGVPIDGPVSLPDGPIGGACTTDAQCGAGMCCFGQLMCVPGTATGLPPPFNCAPE